MLIRIFRRALVLPLLLVSACAAPPPPPPSATVTPSATAIPSATPDAAATAAAATAAATTATAAAQSTATAIAAVTATAATGALFARAEAVFSDEFADNRNLWFTGRFNDVETDLIEDGKFKVKWDAIGTSYELYEVRPFSNFIAEVDCQLVSGDEHASCGLVFGQNNDLGYYKFELFTDYFRLFAVKTGNEPILLSEGYALAAGTEAFQRVRVVREGAQISVAVDGILVTQIEDSTFGEGEIGLSSNSYAESGGVEVWFDNFGLWALP